MLLLASGWEKCEQQRIADSCHGGHSLNRLEGCLTGACSCQNSRACESCLALCTRRVLPEAEREAEAVEAVPPPGLEAPQAVE